MRTGLAVVFALFFVAGCGGGGPEGTYELDVDGVEEAMVDMARQQMEKTLESMPAEMRDRMKEDMEKNMAKTMEEAKKQAEQMKMSLTLEAGGVLTMSGMEGDKEKTGKGTWKIDGDKITLTMTHEDGKEMRKPEAIEGKYDGGEITLKLPGAGFEIRLEK